MVSPIPNGYGSVTTYLVVPNAKEAIEFYGKAFGATMTEHMPGPGGDGTIHAEIRIGNTILMLSDENPQFETASAKSLGGSPVSFMIYCEDCDAGMQRALDAGCELKVPLSDMFWGDRMGKVVDPYGHQWSIATHTEDVSPEEMKKRQEAFMVEMMGGARE